MSVVIELRTGGPTRSLLQQLPDLRQSVANSGTAMTWRGGQSYYLKAVERLEGMFSHSFLDVTWHERLYSNAYWTIRDMPEETVRPFPLLQAEASRLVRWLEDIERELNRIVQQDEWDEGNIPRLLFDISVLIREGTFDTFNWLQIIHSPTQSVRLIIPPLVIRELDDLKNSGKVVKAGPRLRKIYKILDGHSRGPAPISGGTTLELLMDPPDCSRLENHDAEIVRRAGYLEGLPNF